MKVAWIADIHVGNHGSCGGAYSAGLNERCRITIDALWAACRMAEQRGCRALVVLGDIFDSSRPSPQIVAAVGRVLDSFEGEVFVIAGNHDMNSATQGDHALGPLSLCSRVAVVDRPATYERDGEALVLVPFQPGPAHEWLPAATAEALDKRSISSSTTLHLGIHLGIRDSDIAARHAWASSAHDAVDLELLTKLCRAHGIRTAIAGNWHSRRRWPGNPDIIQCGALVPTGWDNPGLQNYGSVWITDGNALAQFFEVVSARFVDYDPNMPLPGWRDLFVRCRAEPKDISVRSAELLKLREAGKIRDFKVVPDRAQAEEQAASASAAARAAETLESAVHEFIERMPVPPKVNRESIHTAVRRHMQGGSG